MDTTGMSVKSLSSILFVAVVGWFVFSSPILAETRLAILIGNQNYNDKVGPLKNPFNDIALVGKSLDSLGFKITYVRDADFATMSKAIKRYAAQVRAAGSDTISFATIQATGPLIPTRKETLSSPLT